MNITLYVHDAILEVGHTRATIEVLRRFPQNKIKKITIVCFHHDNKEKLFPNLDININFIIVPGKNIFPFLLKMIWFHLYTFMIRTRFKDSLQVGIGLASFNAQIINIQFVHQMWSKHYFKIQKLGLISSLYKKTLFFYFNICEKYYYRKQGLKFISLSQFISDYLIQQFSIPADHIVTAYSSVNLEKFNNRENDTKLYQKLKQRYPGLSKIDPTRPIFLFVGAYERKGLPHVFSYLENIPDYQLIIIGKGEKLSSYHPPDGENLCYIEFTQEVELFYQLCDIFIFPTIYEPFGLVLMEAAASGMIIYSLKKEVGAMEVLKDSAQVFDLSTTSIKAQKVSDEERSQLIERRLLLLQGLTWENTSSKWWNFLTQDKQH